MRCSHLKRPRKLTGSSPDSEEADDWNDDLSWQISRPLPSTSILAAMPQKKSKRIPLLEAFGVAQMEDQTTKANDNDDEAADEEIDDPKRSTLTRGQHSVYLRLKHEGTKGYRNNHKQKEFWRLDALVQKEQALYHRALTEFFRKNKARFLLGFASKKTDFSKYHWKYTSAFIKQWIAEANCPVTYGKCRQVISMQTPVSNERHQTWAPEESMTGTIVHGKLTNRKSAPDDTVPKLPADISLPPLLRNDKRALELAERYSATVITTSETLETILMESSSNVSWSVPLWNVAGKQILEPALPKPTLPRNCLEKGMEYSLNEESTIYSLITIQSKTRILVRTTRPRHHHVHIEYFPERGGNEIFSSQEKSLWVLQDIILPSFPHSCWRYDIQQGIVTHKESVGTVHALASRDVAEIQRHFDRLLHILQAPLPNDDHYLLVARHSGDNAGSIHLHRRQNGIGNGEIDLTQVFAKADAVLMDELSLVECGRPTVWTDKARAEYTFPVLDSKPSA